MKNNYNVEISFSLYENQEKKFLITKKIFRVLVVGTDNTIKIWETNKMVNEKFEFPKGVGKINNFSVFEHDVIQKTTRFFLSTDSGFVFLLCWSKLSDSINILNKFHVSNDPVKRICSNHSHFYFFASKKLFAFDFLSSKIVFEFSFENYEEETKENLKIMKMIDFREYNFIFLTFGSVLFVLKILEEKFDLVSKFQTDFPFLDLVQLNEEEVIASANNEEIVLLNLKNI